MSVFFEYIGNITYYLLFAAVVGMFAPSGKYRKYISLVMGFILLLMIIQPFANFGKEISLNIPTMPTIETNSDYSMQWENYLRGSFETQLQAQLARILGSSGYAVHSASFSYSADFSEVTEIYVTVSEEEKNEHVPFIRIQPPQISPIIIGQNSANTEESCQITENVKNIIFGFYNIPKQHIHVEVAR